MIQIIEHFKTLSKIASCMYECVMYIHVYVCVYVYEKKIGMDKLQAVTKEYIYIGGFTQISAFYFNNLECMNFNISLY